MPISPQVTFSGQGEQWYQSLFLAAPDPISIVSMPDGRIFDVNDAYLQFYGYDRQEVISRTTTELNLWANPQQRQNMLEVLQKQGSVHNFEIQTRLKSGTLRWISLTVQKFSVQSQVLHAVFIQDITDRHIHLELLHRYELLAHHIRDVVLVVRRRDGRILEANVAAEKAYGYSREQLLTRTILDLRAPGSHSIAEPQMAQADAEGILFETEHRRRDGSTFPVEVSSRGDIIGDERVLLSVVRDISQRRQTERELHRLNRSLRTLGECNQALIYATDESDLLHHICRIATTTGGYRMAWIGYAQNDPAKSVRPMAQAGFEEGYLETLQITWNDSPRGCGPTGMAIRTGQPSWARDILTDPGFTPWRQEALKRGYASSVVLPLKTEQSVIGALTIYSSLPDAFDAEELKLLTSLADNLAYGIVTLQNRVRQKQSEMALRQSEQRFRKLFDEGPLGMVLVDGDRRLAQVNAKFCRMLGYTPQQLEGRRFDEITYPDDLEADLSLRQQLLDGQIPSFEMEKRYLASDGHIVPVMLSVSKIFSTAQEPDYLLGMVQDLTTRKIMESELLQTQSRLAAMMNAIPDPAWLKDAQGRFLAVNSAWCSFFGLQVDQVLGKTMADFLPPERAAIIAQEDAEIQESRQLIRYDEVLYDTRGQEIWFDTVKSPLFDSSGSIIGTVGIARDITSKKLIQQALRESEAEARQATRRADDQSAQLQAVLGNIEEGVYVTDAAGKVLYYNSAFRQINDCANKEESCIRDGHHINFRMFTMQGEPLPVEQYPLEQLLQGKPVSNRQYRVQTLTGKKMIISISGSIIRADSGNISMVVVTVRDITTIAEAQENLLASEAKYRLLAENMADVIWVLDLKSMRFTYVSPSIQRLRGYTPQEVTQQSLSQVVTPTSLAMVQGRLPQRIDAFLMGAPSAVTQTDEIEQVCRDGSTVWTEVVTTLLQDSAGNLSILGVSRDIHERKQAQKDLAESAQRFRDIFENATDGIMIVNPILGRNITANKHICEMLGRTAEEIASLHVSQLFPPDLTHELMQDFLRHAAGQHTPLYDLPFLRKDGSLIYVDITSFYIQLGGQRLLVGIFHEATERRLLLEQARSYEARLRQLAMEATLAEERERRQLSSHLHDQVCQLLSLAQIRLSLMRQTAEPTERTRLAFEMEDLIERANTSSRSLMLQLSHPALYDLGFVAGAEWLAEDIQRLYDMHVAIWDDGAPKPMDLPIRVVLFQCLRELLVNAAKHAGVDETNVTISLLGHMVRLEVEDHGHGFNPQVLERSDSSGGPGHTAGFGLFSIRERVRSLGGQMQLNSAPGKGTTVILEVPSEISPQQEQKP